MITKPTSDNLIEITQLARIVANDIHMHGIDQWSDTYPAYQNFVFDLEHDGLYVVTFNNKIVGSISLLKENDPFYTELTWNTANALVIHRLMVHPDFMRQKIGSELFKFAIEKAKQEGYPSLKVDTHPDNYRMQNLILSMGFQKIGYMTKFNRNGYELVL